MKHKLSKPYIDKLQPQSKQYAIRDTKVTGLGIRVSPGGRKSFFYEFRIFGRNRTISIGVYGKITLTQAEKAAKQHAATVASGVDPVEVKRKAERQKQRETYTLERAFQDYIAAPVKKGRGKGKSKKPGTIKDIEKQRDKFKDWLNLPVSSITRKMVKARYTRLSKTSVAQANLAMRYLRAALNHVIQDSDDDENPILARNPVNKLTDTSAWQTVERRSSYILSELMPQWFESVTNLDAINHGDIQRDCLLLMLFTGIRPSEAIDLRWDGVDFNNRTLTFRDTKSRRDHTLPLTEWLSDLLIQRESLSGSEYVFSTPEGYRLKDVRPAQSKIKEDTNIQFMPTDLRRTFITKAESLGLSTYSLKRLLNHTQADDVTGGYVQIEIDRLRDPMQRTEDAILRDAGVKSADVIELRAATK